MTSAKLTSHLGLAAALLLSCTPEHTPKLGQSIARPPVIEREARVARLPLGRKMTKLTLAASIKGVTRDFVFDTGSPTILNRNFAASLDLEIIGQSTGRDANGRLVTMDVAVVERLSLGPPGGGLTFRQVPVLIFDFARLELGPCLFDGGVIGSEIMPGNAWRIDTEQHRLDIAATQDDLPPAAHKIPLHSAGYPYAPLIPYEIGAVRDFALFDTGNSGQLVLYAPVARAPSVQRRIQPGTLRRGRGSAGVSASGAGEVGTLTRFTLSETRLGDEPLGLMVTTTRKAPPSLIGAALLDQYIVTLDYTTDTLLLQKRQNPVPASIDPGYALSIVDGAATVTQLFEDSPAARAGLRLGDRVISVNGHQLNGADPVARCESATWLTETFDRTAATELLLQRRNGPETIRIPATQ